MKRKKHPWRNQCGCGGVKCGDSKMCRMCHIRIQQGKPPTWYENSLFVKGESWYPIADQSDDPDARYG